MIEIASRISELEAVVQKAYENRCQTYPDSALGWRLLYSPRRVLFGARVAFIGLNPGGKYIDPDHGEFSTEAGSAYRKDVEDWGPNTSLQEQVLSLFERLGEEAEDVLAGNLVPFRSPSEKSMQGATEALIFGTQLWTEIFTLARPSVVVSMGGTANRAISGLLNVQGITPYATGWGNYKAYRGQFPRGTWIGLPHLSRFGIMTRSASDLAVDELFKGVSERSPRLP